MEIFKEMVYWGVLVSVGSYLICQKIQNRKKIVFLNPLLFSTIFTILFLVVFKIDYSQYYKATDILYYLLSPATVCLAIPLYEQVIILKRNIKAIFLGITSGVIASMLSVLLFSMLFRFSHTMYVTLLPKSVTAAIAMSISEEMGGVASVTIPIVIMTGITGHIIAGKVCSIFKISEPIAIGIAIGSASHAMGTTKAMEMGDIQGAMSSLSIAVAGVITVLCTFLFTLFY